MPRNGIIFRIDDRLIHGQVLVGWGAHYPIQQIIVANDEIASNDWERELLTMAAPPEMAARVVTLAEAVAYANEHMDSKGLRIILVNSPQDVQTMADLGMKLRDINVGGVHFVEGRKEYLTYLYLSPEEVTVLRSLMARGFKFECRDVPTNSKHSLAAILG